MKSSKLYLTFFRIIEIIAEEEWQMRTGEKGIKQGLLNLPKEFGNVSQAS
jgi:hypothetical protein